MKYFTKSSERASECLLAPRYTRFIAFTSKNIHLLRKRAATFVCKETEKKHHFTVSWEKESKVERLQ